MPPLKQDPLSALLLRAVASMATWRPLQWVGFVLAVAAFYLPRFVAVVGTPWDDMLDHAAMLGALLMAGPAAKGSTVVVTAPPPPAPPTPPPQPEVPP